MSLDQFYALVTGQQDAFYQICMALPEVIQAVVDDAGEQLVPHDIVFEQLSAMADKSGIEKKDVAIAMAIYMLGFGSYNGFSK